MLGEIEIWLAADELIKVHGAQAVEAADQRVDEMLDQNDSQGAYIWAWIMVACGGLLGSNGQSTAIH